MMACGSSGPRFAAWKAVIVLPALAPGRHRDLQQETAATNARLAVQDAPIRGWEGMNEVQRGPLRHFASKGLGFESPWLHSVIGSGHR